MESGEVHSAAQPDMRRKLAVILASDVAGYSRLVAADEEDTVRRFRQAAAAFCERVQKYRGRVFNTAGDAILAEFESAVDATRCAVDIQDANNAQNAAIEASRRLLFRIGIAIGDVLVSDNGDLLGDGVNIAARLEGIAAPGGICISEDVRTHVLNKISVGFQDLGEQTLKNIPRAVRAFRLGAAGGNAPAPAAKSKRRFGGPPVWVGGAVATVAVAVSGVVVIARYPSAPAPPAAFSPVAAVAGADRRFDPANVPLVTDRVRSDLVDYVRQPDFKAIAISRLGLGVSRGLPDQVAAERDALDRCKRRDPNGDCRIYAVGDSVVWPSSPTPLPADLHTEPLDIALQPADSKFVKGMPTEAGIDAFLKAKSHKALAVSEAGFSSGFSTMPDRTDSAEAIRLAVERCSDFAKSPCVLVSVDGFLTVRIPRSYGRVRLYTLGGDTEMGEADKERIAKIYGGKDWRALAKGGSGRWYAVNAAESETAAADRVMEDCRRAETQCELRAIGNFRVDKR